MSADRREFLKGLIASSAMALPTNTSSLANPQNVKDKAFDPGYYGLINYENGFIDHLFPFPENFKSRAYQVVVIGSGMGGGTVANLLSNMGVKVLVIEAGTLLLQSNVANLPIEQNLWRELCVANFDSRTPQTTSDLCTYIGLGGKSAIWNGHVIPRFKYWELDYFSESIKRYLFDEGGYEEGEQIMFKNVTRGPFEDKLFDKLRELLPREYRLDKLPTSNQQPYLSYKDDKLSVENIIQHSAGMYSSLDVLMNSTRRDDHGHDYLFVALNRLVKYIKTDNKRATKIVCHNMITDQEETYEAKFVILAAGTIESAAIALRSGLKDNSQKIGKGLTDAPTLGFKQFKILEGNFDNFNIGTKDHARYLITHLHSNLDVWFWNAQLLVNPRYWMIRNADVRIPVADEGKEPMGEFFLYFSSELDERNVLELVGDRFKPEVTINENDLRDYATPALKAVEEIVRLLGVSMPQQNIFYKNASSHTVGSLRINVDDKKGVVDDNLRFHQYENLYACDLSVFPFVSASQPSLTLVSLANRLAKHIHSLL